MEEDLVKGFVKKLYDEEDYTDWGIGQAMAFLYINLETINKITGG